MVLNIRNFSISTGASALRKAELHLGVTFPAAALNLHLEVSHSSESMCSTALVIDGQSCPRAWNNSELFYLFSRFLPQAFYTIAQLWLSSTELLLEYGLARF